MSNIIPYKELKPIDPRRFNPDDNFDRNLLRDLNDHIERLKNFLLADRAISQNIQSLGQNTRATISRTGISFYNERDFTSVNLNSAEQNEAIREEIRIIIELYLSQKPALENIPPAREERVPLRNSPFLPASADQRSLQPEFEQQQSPRSLNPGLIGLDPTSGTLPDQTCGIRLSSEPSPFPSYYPYGSSSASFQSPSPRPGAGIQPSSLSLSPHQPDHSRQTSPISLAEPPSSPLFTSTHSQQGADFNADRLRSALEEAFRSRNQGQTFSLEPVGEEQSSSALTAMQFMQQQHAQRYPNHERTIPAGHPHRQTLLLEPVEELSTSALAAHSSGSQQLQNGELVIDLQSAFERNQALEQHQHEIAALRKQMAEKEEELRQLNALQEENRRQASTISAQQESLRTLYREGTLLNLKCQHFEEAIKAIITDYRIKDSEAEALKAQIASLQSQLKAKEEEVQNYSSENDRLRRLAVTLERENPAAQNELAERERALRGFEARINELQQTKARMEVEIETLEQTTEEQSKRISELSREQSHGQSQVQVENRDPSSARLPAAQAEDETAQRELREISERSQKAREEREKLKSDLKETQSLLGQKRDELNQVQAQLRSAAQDQNTQNEELRVQKAALARLAREKAETEAAISQNQAEKSRKEEELAPLRSSLEAARREEESLQKELKNLKDQAQSANEEKEKIVKELQETAHALEQRKAELAQARSSLEALNGEMSQVEALRNTFTQQVQEQATLAAESAQTALELNNIRTGNAALQAELTTAQSEEARLRKALEDLGVQHEASLKASQELEGQIREAERIKASKKSDLEQVRNTLQELEQSLARENGHRESLNSQARDLTASNEVIVRQIQAAREQEQSLQKELKAAEQRKEAALKAGQELERQIREAEQTQALNKRALEQVRGELTALGQSLARENRNREALTGQVQDRAVSNQTLTDQLRAATEQAESLQRELKAAQERKEAAVKAKEELIRELKAAEDIHAHRTERHEQVKKALVELEQSLNKANIRQTQLSREIGVTNVSNESLSGQLKAAKEQEKRLKRELADASQNVRELTDQIPRAALQRENEILLKAREEIGKQLADETARRGELEKALALQREANQASESRSASALSQKDQELRTALQKAKELDAQMRVLQNETTLALQKQREELAKAQKEAKEHIEVLEQTLKKREEEAEQRFRSYEARIKQIEAFSTEEARQKAEIASQLEKMKSDDPTNRHLDSLRQLHDFTQGFRDPAVKNHVHLEELSALLGIKEITVENVNRRPAIISFSPGPTLDTFIVGRTNIRNVNVEVNRDPNILRICSIIPRPTASSPLRSGEIPRQRRSILSQIAKTPPRPAAKSSVPLSASSSISVSASSPVLAAAVSDSLASLSTQSSLTLSASPFQSPSASASASASASSSALVSSDNSQTLSVSSFPSPRIDLSASQSASASVSVSSSAATSSSLSPSPARSHRLSISPSPLSPSVSGSSRSSAAPSEYLSVLNSNFADFALEILKIIGKKLAVTIETEWVDWENEFFTTPLNNIMLFNEKLITIYRSPASLEEKSRAYSELLSQHPLRESVIKLQVLRFLISKVCDKLRIPPEQFSTENLTAVLAARIIEKKRIDQALSHIRSITDQSFDLTEKNNFTALLARSQDHVRATLEQKIKQLSAMIEEQNKIRSPYLADLTFIKDKLGAQLTDFSNQAAFDSAKDRLDTLYAGIAKQQEELERSKKELDRFIGLASLKQKAELQIKILKDYLRIFA